MKKILSTVLIVALFLAFAVLFLHGCDLSKKENKRSEVHVGETLNQNGFKITLDSAETWSSGNQFIHPAEGKQFVRLHFTVVNETGKERGISGMDFDSYADDEKCEISYLGDKILYSGGISPGRKATGYLYYEIPFDAREIEVEYHNPSEPAEIALFIVDTL